jgi:secreted trypsin-like serine protease
MQGFDGHELISILGSAGESGTKRIWLVYTYQEEYENWLKARNVLSRKYSIILEKKWAQDPDSGLKRRFFKKNFSPYRIVAELYERKE